MVCCLVFVGMVLLCITQCGDSMVVCGLDSSLVRIGCIGWDIVAWGGDGSMGMRR